MDGTTSGPSSATAAISAPAGADGSFAMSASAASNSRAASGTFIKALPLSDAITASVIELAASTQADRDFSGQMHLLAASALTQSKNWSKMAISRESWDKVAELRSQIMGESDKLIPVVSAVNPSALYMSENAMIIQFNKGSTPIKNFLTMEEDCALVIPLSFPTPDEVFIWQEGRANTERYHLALQINKGYVMKGTTVVNVADPDPTVCLIFCLAMGGSSD